MRRSILVMLVASLMVMAGASAAFAGEWAPGGPNNGHTTPVWDYVAESICSFSGADESDASEDHYGEPGDDEQWGSTPAGANSEGKAMVQSGGQFVASVGSSDPGAVAGFVAAGFFSGFGEDCRPGGGEH